MSKLRFDSNRGVYLEEGCDSPKMSEFKVFDNLELCAVGYSLTRKGASDIWRQFVEDTDGECCLNILVRDENGKYNVVIV